ncbi:MAG TPA: hypothetical protein VEC12_01690, partial [Bacteroidia bacterium]|nr:hypothetical protein [Bacteroidia bacterium]
VVFLVAIIAGAVLLYRKKYKTGFLSLLMGTMVTLQLYLYIIVPKIEQYSQGAAIQFWESLQGKDVYAQPLGYDTYAHYFYTRVKPWDNAAPDFQRFRSVNEASFRERFPTDWFDHLLREWLLDGRLDKPAYFCCHISKAEEYARRPNFIKIGEDGGFVFFKREPAGGRD